jgi:putative endonuclease
MKPIGTHNYYTYILTNKNRTVLYTGVTNDLRKRLWEHEQGLIKMSKAFTGKYRCVYLLYYERFQYVDHAISREKEIKGWTRAKKNKLISESNPDWKFLNEEVE